MIDDLDRLTAALAGRYAIERELGAGGMATVYLARDLKHDRNVALKVLRPELAAVLGAERFSQEIKITANLNHPHILPLLDSGTAEEQPTAVPPYRRTAFLFYVMPHIDGPTLRDRLNREKQLPVEDALKITEQVASALEYAHRRDVIHRDIKPENILFHEGVAMVADFGIALAVKTAGGERLTETGLSLGTPAYMSPEQVAGDRDIDGRSDIYSLACVLYEMLAGDPPFLASSPQAVLAKHVTDPAPPITTVRSSVPQPVAAAIAKALGKARADRFESAKVFSDALFVKSTQAEREVKSIVVLPFENLSPDPDQEYFSDGLTEEVISDLSKVHALRVISRSSAMTLKGSHKRIPDIARELNVRYALEGSVRKAGNSLRITAQLIDALDDAHMWADKYNGTLDNVFEMQEQVSRAIVDALKVTLTPKEQQRIGERKIDNVAAFECFLKANQEIFKFTEESLNRAIRYLENALDIIGPNAHLYAGLAWAYWMLVNFSVLQEDGLDRVDEFVEKALALDPEFSAALAIRGMMFQAFRNNLPESGRYLKRALSANPDETIALIGLAAICIYVGRISEAYPFAAKLLDVDPLNFGTGWSNGAVHYYSGSFGKAVESWQRLHTLEPENPLGRFYYSLALAADGRVDEALGVLESLDSSEPDNAAFKLGHMLERALRGDRGCLERELTPELRKTVMRDLEWSWYVADMFAMVNDRDEALMWLENSTSRGVCNYPMLAEHDPFLKNIRGEERFKELMVRVKKEWEEFEV